VDRKPAQPDSRRVTPRTNGRPRAIAMVRAPQREVSPKPHKNGERAPDGKFLPPHNGP